MNEHTTEALALWLRERASAWRREAANCHATTGDAEAYWQGQADLAEASAKRLESQIRISVSPDGLRVGEPVTLQMD
jgi:hypothetical protein